MRLHSENSQTLQIEVWKLIESMQKKEINEGPSDPTMLSEKATNANRKEQ